MKFLVARAEKKELQEIQYPSESGRNMFSFWLHTHTLILNAWSSSAFPILSNLYIFMVEFDKDGGSMYDACLCEKWNWIHMTILLYLCENLDTMRCDTIRNAIA